MMGLCEVCGYSGEIIYHASELREKYSFSFWDSHIIASALASQCGVLASEDMQDGLKIRHHGYTERAKPLALIQE